MQLAWLAMLGWEKDAPILRWLADGWLADGDIWEEKWWEDLCLRAFAASMGEGSMFNAIYLDIRRLIRAKAEVIKAKTKTVTIILESLFNFC